MKKLCGGSSSSGSGGGGGRKGKVHPSPTSTNPDHHLTLLAALPAAILALTAALTVEDREVLAYLISCGGERRTHLEEGEKAAARRRRAGAAPAESPPPTPSFGCSCFRCYTSYWARWDASPNRQLIHEIIDALEEETLLSAASAGRRKAKPGRRGRTADAVTNPGRRRGGGGAGGGVAEEEVVGVEKGLDGGGHLADVEDDEQDEEDDGEEEEEDEGRSPVRRLVNYLGERIWGVWSL